MNLSPGQAAESLKEIERTQRRSAELHEYANSSPHFILWGLVWIAGYTGSYLLPHYGFSHGINWLWFGLGILGGTGSTFLDRRQYRELSPSQRAAGRAKGRRIGLSLFATFLFVAASFVVMRPVNVVAVGAYMALITALAYTIIGIWRGLRFLYIGIVVAALTLGGWFYLPHYFLLWMAVVGGGSLVLVGLWLRKV